MSKMFSVVTLSSDYGMWVEYFATGCPDCADDLLDDTVIRDDLASQPKDRHNLCRGRNLSLWRRGNDTGQRGRFG